MQRAITIEPAVLESTVESDSRAPIEVARPLAAVIDEKDAQVLKGASKRRNWITCDEFPIGYRALEENFHAFDLGSGNWAENKGKQPSSVTYLLGDAQIADLLKLIHGAFPRLDVNLGAPARVELSRLIAGLRHQAIEQSKLLEGWSRLELLAVSIGQQHVEKLLHACAIANDLIEQDIERERKAAFADHKDGGSW
jgi:hypothetical protein